MIRHIVLQRFKSQYEIAERLAALAELDELITGLRARMPGLLAHAIGPDLGLTDGAFEAALVIDAADVEAWRAYQEDDAHRDFVRNRLGPMLEDRAVIQLEVAR